MRVGWLAVVLVCACGDNLRVEVDAPPVVQVAPWQGGARMRPRVVVADDGFKTLIGWHDEQLGFDCDQPYLSPVACGADTRFYPVRYADAACQQPLVDTSSGGWVWDGSHTWSIEATEFTGTQYSPTASGCGEASPYGDSVYLAHLDDRIAVSARGSLPGDPRLVRWSWPDGAYGIVPAGFTNDSPPYGDPAGGATRLREILFPATAAAVPTGIFDSQLAVNCWPATVGPDLRCGARVHGASEYIDPACTQRVATCPTPGLCLSEYGAVVIAGSTPRAGYVQSGNSCVSGPKVLSAAPVPPEQLALLRIEIE